MRIGKLSLIEINLLDLAIDRIEELRIALTNRESGPLTAKERLVYNTLKTNQLIKARIEEKLNY